MAPQPDSDIPGSTPLFDELITKIEADYASLTRTKFLKKLSRSISKHNLPLACCISIAESALAKDDQDVVETILVFLDARGDAHPLLDQVKANYLMGKGQRRKALELLRQSVEKWDRPYLAALKERLERDGDL